MANNRTGKTKNQSRHTKRRKLTLIACFAVCAYFVISIISVQMEIYKEKQKLADIQQQINDTQLENDELSRIVYGAGEAEYIERIAREKLGYAAADERIFEDVAGSGELSETTGDGAQTAGDGADTPAETDPEADQETGAADPETDPNSDGGDPGAA